MIPVQDVTLLTPLRDVRWLGHGEQLPPEQMAEFIAQLSDIIQLVQENVPGWVEYRYIEQLEEEVLTAIHELFMPAVAEPMYNHASAWFSEVNDVYIEFLKQNPTITRHYNKISLVRIEIHQNYLINTFSIKT